MFCNGALLSISEYETLLTLIGTTYGGNGQSTFALTNLQGRVPIYQGQNYLLGETSGVESETLSQAQIPFCNHTSVASSMGNSDSQANNFWANSTNGKPYTAATLQGIYPTRS